MVLAEQLLQRLEHFGFQDYIVPFLLVWILIYGVLKKINIFGETANVDEFLSIIAAFLVVGYTPFVEQYFQVYITNLFGAIAILLVAMLGFFLLVGMMLGNEGRDYLQRKRKYVMGAIGVAVVFLFVSYGGPRMILGPEQLGQVGVERFMLLSRADFYLLLLAAGVIGFMYWTMGGSFAGGDTWVLKAGSGVPESKAGASTGNPRTAKKWKNAFGEENVTFTGEDEPDAAQP